MSLSREQILAADDVKIVKVSVPEWGGDVYVRSLLSEQRDDVTATVDQETKKVRFEQLLALTLCDENGESLGFTAEDVVRLKKKGLAPITKLGIEAMKINGMSQEATDATKN